jgi:hypothetical protein
VVRFRSYGFNPGEIAPGTDRVEGWVGPTTRKKSFALAGTQSHEVRQLVKKRNFER